MDKNKQTNEIDYHDLPVNELVTLADKVVRDYQAQGITPDVHFKHTCENCQSRNMFEMANTLHDEIECGHCGHKAPFTKGGFALVFKFPQGLAQQKEVKANA